MSIGNGATVGGGLPVNPTADPQSGRMDVMICFAHAGPARAAYGVALVRSKHLQRDDVLHRRVTSVSVSGEPFHVTADGEELDPSTRRSWQIQAAAFEMTLPETAGDQRD